jgi:hypothetical protein
MHTTLVLIVAALLVNLSTYHVSVPRSVDARNLNGGSTIDCILVDASETISRNRQTR